MLRTLTALLALSLVACTTTGPAPSSAARTAESREEREREREREREKEKESLTPATPEDAAFERALDTARSRKSWNDLRIDADCQDQTQLPRTVRLYGSGIGIWNHQRLFTVPRETLIDLLAEVDRARFSRLPDTFESDEGEGEEEGFELTCRVGVALDGTEKQAQQILEREESPVLKALADHILDVGEKLGPAGITVTSLEDGLEKIARGELAPELLTLQLLRRPEDAHSSEGGWMLRIESGEARLSRISDAGWSAPRRIRLSAADVAGLAGALAGVRPSDLPANLYSTWYQDLQIDVLNRTKSIQARQFARMTPETHGEKQQRFDQLVAALEALEARFRNAPGSR